MQGWDPRPPLPSPQVVVVVVAAAAVAGGKINPLFTLSLLQIIEHAREEDYRNKRYSSICTDGTYQSGVEGASSALLV